MMVCDLLNALLDLLPLKAEPLCHHLRPLPLNFLKTSLVLIEIPSASLLHLLLVTSVSRDKAKEIKPSFRPHEWGIMAYQAKAVWHAGLGE
jgi:hypothetical protein